jgi:hypothetical protein
MKKMNLATGSMVLLGFIFILFGLVLKMSGLNLLEPLFSRLSSFFAIANTCFLAALIIDRFDKPVE